MDDIQCVDCFERLHQHLLLHEPDFQKRADALEPYAYRSRDLTFLLTHLVALLSGIDEQTAEGRRRIRRLLAEIDETQPTEWARKHLGKGLRIREQGGVWEKPVGKKQEEDLAASLGNMNMLSEDPAQTGEALHTEIEKQENLPARIAWLRRLAPSLSSLNAFDYLSRIGYPVVVPDGGVQTVLFRLGLIEKAGRTLTLQLEAAHASEGVAAVVQRPAGEINLWLRAFAGLVPGLSPRTALCRRSPLCNDCPLQPYCSFFRFQRPRAAGENAPLPIPQWRPTERPRERLMQHGATSLEETELLAIVLRTGAGKVNVLELARRLLERFGSLRGIEEASLEELQSIHGIGKMKAIELKAVFELGRRLIFNPIKPGDAFTSSDDVFHSYRARFSQVKQEEFILLMLDNKNRVIREEVVSRGGIDASVVQPREVFKAAMPVSAF